MASIAGSKRIAKQVNFVMCESCFWCASDLAGGMMEKCPSCKSERLESIPISPGERYSFDYTLKCGVALEFVSVKN